MLPHGFFLVFIQPLLTLFRPNVHCGSSQLNLVNYKFHIFLRQIWDYQQYSNNVLFLSDEEGMQL